MNMTLFAQETAEYIEQLSPEQRMELVELINTSLNSLNVPFQLAGKPGQQVGDPGDK